MNYPHKHHWLPQFIQRHFIDPIINRFYIYDIEKKKFGTSTPSAICFKRDLYAIDADEVSEELKFGVETVVNKCVEDESAPIIESLDRGGNLNVAGKEILARFISLQLLRHPKTLDFFLKRRNELDWQRLKRIIFDDAELVKCAADTGKTFDPVVIRKFRDCFTYGRVEVDNEHAVALQEMARSFPHLTNDFMDSEWRVLRPPKGAVFITSDNPVTVIRGNDRFRAILIPMTPNFMVEIVPGQKKIMRAVMTREGVRRRNLVTASNAIFYVISNSEALLKHVVSRCGISGQII